MLITIAASSSTPQIANGILTRTSWAIDRVRDGGGAASSGAVLRASVIGGSPLRVAPRRLAQKSRPAAAGTTSALRSCRSVARPYTAKPLGGGHHGALARQGHGGDRRGARHRR